MDSSSNYYDELSECIDDLSDEALDWAILVMGLDSEDNETELRRELSVDGNFHLDDWPTFSITRSGSALFVYCEEYCNLDHVTVFVRELIARFDPDRVFTMSVAHYCSSSRPGEFGGSWAVVAKDGVESRSSGVKLFKSSETLSKRRTGLVSNTSLN